MTKNDADENDGTGDDHDATERTLAMAAPGSYKVLGDLADPGGGIGVLGRNTAGSGATKGVEGRVDSPDGHGLATPDDAKVDGTLATTGSHEVTVDGNRALSLGSESSSDAGAVVLGHSSNSATAVGATIGGGGFDSGSTVQPNRVEDSYGVVGGGVDNRVEASSFGGVIGGGNGNRTKANYGTVGGGTGNVVDGSHSTIAGGRSNEVYDDYGTVGGGEANWAGSDDSDTATAPHATVGGGMGNGAESGTATVGGGEGNTVSGQGGTISGGTSNAVTGSEGTVGGGSNNEASGLNATVAGGDLNVANASTATIAGGRNARATEIYTSVGGGWRTEATGKYATAGGGTKNVASGNGATVPGGQYNTASGYDSFAAGRFAKAADGNAFVWNDGTAHHDIDSDGNDEGFSSAKDVAGSGVRGTSTFNVSAGAGVRFVTGSNAVTYIPAASTGWSTTSTRSAKTNVDPVDPDEMLAGVESMDVATWEYEGKDGDGAGVTHVGPMAEDFHEAFDAGDSDQHINSINADGVAFAAIQGLAERLAAKEDRIENLEARIASLEASEDPPESPADD